MDNSLINDKIRGSLIGGAIGDALGYPVEFLPWSNIQNKYGARVSHAMIQQITAWHSSLTIRK